MPSPRRPSGRLALLALPVLASSWALLWTQTSYWNPLFFFGTWLGAALLLYALGPAGYPGWRRHLVLAAVSVPLWWWFELVNSRVENWEYVTPYDYGVVPYALLASLTFSTVVPALDAAWRLTTASLGVAPHRRLATEPGRRYWMEVGAGGLAVLLVFVLPGLFFPLVWVGPFLVSDGLIALRGGRNLVADIYHRGWRLAAAIGLAGLICGVLWEFWNFWATPKWVYHLTYFDFFDVFEMPILGYLGYVPFAWCVYQLTRLRPPGMNVDG